MIYEHRNPHGTGERDLAAHHGQTCTVVHELGDDARDPEVGPMWRVRFGDGYEADAFADELNPAPSKP